MLCVGDGHTYERWAIEKWLATHHGRSPMTNLPLKGKNRTLVTNVALKKAIASVKQHVPASNPSKLPVWWT